MSARERAAEVLATHADMTDRSATDGCECGGCSDPKAYEAHVADALAEAGLLREDDWRHVAELERLRAEENRHRAEKAERERNEAREALARAEALADEMAADPDPGVRMAAWEFRVVLRGGDDQ